MSQGVRALLVAVVVVLLAGVAFAAFQPGNLGDDDDGETAAEVTTTTSTTDPDVAGTTSTTAADPDVTTSTSQVPSSGLGTDGSGSAGDDDLADTGGLPLLLPGGLLLAGAMLSRRLLTR